MIIFSEARDETTERAKLQRFEKPQSLDIDGSVFASILYYPLNLTPKSYIFIHLLIRLAPQIKITPMSDLESDTDSASGPCSHQSGMNYLR